MKKSRKRSSLRRIVSGGQTGVDRAALDVALELSIPAGGWCPQGRRAEDGPLPARYELQETPSRRYAQRTRWNVRDSDGTLVLLLGAARGGTALTLASAEKQGRPVLLLDLEAPLGGGAFRKWLEAHRVARLNVAGPRESQRPGIYARAAEALRLLLG